MEEKNWYIYRKDHHVGPYSFIQLESFLDQGDLSKNSVVWKEGCPGWQSVVQWSDFNHYLFEDIRSAKVELPPIPEDNAYPTHFDDEILSVEESPRREDRNHQSEHYSYGRIEKGDLESISLGLAADSRAFYVEVAEPIDHLELSTLSIEEKLPSLPSLELPPIPLTSQSIEVATVSDRLLEIPSSDFLNLKWASFITLSFVLIFTISFFIENGIDRENFILKGLIPLKSAKLKSILGQEGPVRFELAMKKDESGIWLSSNLKKKSEIFIILKSVTSKILGLGSVVLKAKAKFDHSPILLQKFEFVEGDRIIPGLYDYKIEVRSSDFLTRVTNFFTKDQKNLNLSTFRGEFFGFGGSEAAFKKKKEKYYAQSKNRKMAFFNLFIEKYKTLNSILNQVEDLYSRSLRSVERGRDIKTFELSYLSLFSPILQRILIRNTELYQKEKSKDLERSNFYSDMVTYTKNLAALAALMVEETEKIKRVTTEKKLGLHGLFSEKSKDMRQELGLQQEFFENKVQLVKGPKIEEQSKSKRVP